MKSGYIKAFKFQCLSGLLLFAVGFVIGYLSDGTKFEKIGTNFAIFGTVGSLFYFFSGCKILYIGKKNNWGPPQPEDLDE